MAGPNPPTLVVLLSPSALGSGDVERVAGMLSRSAASQKVRALVWQEGGADAQLGAVLAQAKIDARWIIAGGGADSPADALHWPRDVAAMEGIAFSVALADVVIVGAGCGASPLARTARSLQRPIAAPGENLPLLAEPSFEHFGLAPYSGIFRPALYVVAGRIDAIFLALFRLRGSRQGLLEGAKELAACFRSGSRQAVAFPPDRWREDAPDPRMLADDGALRIRFEALERGALFGSRLHRDIIWLVHFLAAAAVLLAIFGVNQNLPGSGPAVVEAGTLFFVLVPIVWMRFNGLQERWTACRLAAEQIRIACMCLPLMLAPPVLAPAAPSEEFPARRAAKGGLADAALDQAMRAIREQGPSIPQRGFGPQQALAWLGHFVREQAAYHRDNRRRLELAEHGMRDVTLAIFLASFVVVLAHAIASAFLAEGKSSLSLLYVTAFGPTLAAAIHGAASRLGVAHRSAFSETAAEQLEGIVARFEALQRSDSGHEQRRERATWRDVRGLARAAAEAMGAESASWHQLLRYEPDDPP